jgi:SAM-dependent methyltransferase
VEHDPRRFSAIAHDGIVLWNPLPEAATLALVDSLDVAPTDRVLDVGCGRAELLIRLVVRTGAHGVGVDPWPHAIATARAAAAGRVDASRLEFRGQAFDASRFADGSIDRALCVGATHAMDGLRGTLQTFRRLLVPDGTAIVGEGHWLREPDAEYLAFLDAKRDDLLDLAGNLALARESGFDVVRELVSSKEDFDVYEDRYAANVERWTAEHPDDPDADAFRVRVRAWRAAHLRWGRDTLGFALYVLRRR